MAILTGLAHAGFEYELVQRWQAKVSTLTAQQDADEQVKRLIATKKYKPADASAMRSFLVENEKVARKTTSGKGPLQISAGDWGSEVVYPIIDLSNGGTSAFHERFDGRSTAASSWKTQRWDIGPDDRRGLGGNFLDFYLLTGYLDSRIHRIESSRTPEGKWKDVFERKVPKSTLSTHVNERFTLVWNDARRTRLLSAFAETATSGARATWRKAPEYQIIRQSPPGSGRLIDEATATRFTGSRRRTEHYVFKRKIPDPSLPYDLLHDMETGAELTETGIDPGERITYAYEGIRIDPHERVARNRRFLRLGLIAVVTFTLIGLGYALFHSRRPSARQDR
ncbi:hypothetical protein EON81_15155 [bacterium]|nr:MAG: hypothetical protein EON81_15155 [bacterium]